MHQNSNIHNTYYLCIQHNTVQMFQNNQFYQISAKSNEILGRGKPKKQNGSQKTIFKIQQKILQIIYLQWKLHYTKYTQINNPYIMNLLFCLPIPSYTKKFIYKVYNLMLQICYNKNIFAYFCKFCKYLQKCVKYLQIFLLYLQNHSQHTKNQLYKGIKKVKSKIQITLYYYFQKSVTCFATLLEQVHAYGVSEKGGVWTPCQHTPGSTLDIKIKNLDVLELKKYMNTCTHNEKQTNERNTSIIIKFLKFCNQKILRTTQSSTSYKPRPSKMKMNNPIITHVTHQQQLNQ
eukprot:TRINITY_DN4773_c0_g1_i1.p1 TRINITY_DN4773_c0_g1~~TRINITY_DN4773_c0_g1_i1.p1  ORF type:complete len:290 (-),score=-15.64 TRINITY_DN4773_c0_g1_i1:238-1107(-)